MITLCEGRGGEFDLSSLDGGNGPIGKELLFEYIEGGECELLGVKLQYYVLKNIYNGVVYDLYLTNN